MFHPSSHMDSKPKWSDKDHKDMDKANSGATTSQSAFSQPLEELYPPPPHPQVIEARLDELAGTLSTLKSTCAEFTSNLPRDARTCDIEYRKLNELGEQILLNLDALIIKGNMELRKERKAMVNETQFMLDALHALTKKNRDRN